MQILPSIFVDDEKKKKAGRQKGTRSDMNQWALGT
jgi:hypothetical protein